MNAVFPQEASSTAAAASPFRVDPSRGEHRGDVSQQWFSRPHDQRFLDLDELYGAVLRRYEASFETRIVTRDVEFFGPELKTREDMHKLFLGLPGGKQVSPTHWSFGQLAGLAGAPAGYLHRLPSPLVADNLNWGLRHVREVEEVKLYGGEAQLYAATGPDYGRIPDYEVVEAVRQIAGTGRGEMRWKVPGVLDWSTNLYNPEAPVTKESTTLYASDRDVFCFLVDDRNPIEVGKLQDGSPDLMFRGFFIQNSEVGSRALKLAAFYLRAVCMNRNLWGVEGFEELSIRHTKMAPDRWLQQAQPALRSYAEGSTQKLIEGVQAAKAAKVAEDDEKALEFLRSRSFSVKDAKAVLETVEREEGRKARTIWDFAQGITAFARGKPNTDDRLEIELEAKRLLDKVAA